MADGIEGVLCAADGGRLIVVFDAETGAPVEPSIVFDRCGDCTAANGDVLVSAVTVASVEQSTSTKPQFTPQPVLLHTLPAHQARGPPV